MLSSPPIHSLVCSVAGLRALVMEDMVLRELPRAISAAAASLTRLRLDVNYSDAVGAG